MTNSRDRLMRFRRRGLAMLLAAALASGLPARSEQPPLSALDLAGLLKVVESRGGRVTIPPPVQSSLGLTPAQASPGIKQAAYMDEQGTRHGFAPLNDRSGYFMFRLGKTSGQTVFHVDPQLHLVRAASSFRGNDDLIGLPEQQAQRELGEEFAGWSRILAPGAALAPATPPASPRAGAAAPKPPAR
jgi:hypothetical protein